MAHTIYTTMEGDRFDTISYKAYGDVKYKNLIIQANQSICIDIPIPASTKVFLPIMEIQVESSILPPWKK